MNIAKTLDQYNNNYVHLCESIKNNIMNEGQFIRILYSTPYFSLNGIYLYFTINDVIVEKYYNKYKCHFQLNNHLDICEKIRIIDESLLKKVNLQNKNAQFKIYEQLMNGNIKIFCNTPPKQNNMGFLLKISGIWETINQYGVTYKFSKIDHF